MRFYLPILMLATLFIFGSCAQEVSDQYKIRIEIGGSSTQASIFWETDRELNLEENQPLPWIKEFVADKGEHYYVLADVSVNEDRLWIRILEDGEPVNTVNGCICGGSSLRAEAGGYFGEEQTQW
jgi:hypothetical protein